MVYDMILFVLVYLYSFYLVIGGNDWFMIWLGLEINMMMFIMIMFSRYSVFNIESCLSYFFIQSLGSAIFMGLFYIGKEYMDFVLCLTLGYKMGAGPFFFWFPSVCSGISWMSCFVLMSFQKIIPLMLISMFISWVFFFVVVVSLLMGVFGSFNQRDLKRLMAYSSIYHLGWILLCILIDSESWFNYLLIYMLMVFPVIFFMKVEDISDLMDMVKVSSSLWMTVIMLSMAGMPPFLGFFLKWFAFSMIMGYSIFYMVVLVVCSIVMFYVYFRVIYDVLVGYFCYSSWVNYFMDSSSSVWLEFLCVLGMLFGVGVGIVFIM
uniref:NADH dehydrogenase subunit 2 n=1 Tax=Phoneutria boliviensis TaxID=2598454 RepID=UPI001D130514|nr:NADH dehydrogenase subunit 2 [Phoneutria boliviensis]UBY46219.1 NADH dehydrogenase subunit 2 [Phoneutria boliviensis]